MAMDKGVKEMIEQLKINNEFQRQLLKEKIEDEKPSERLADQIPEIVADSEFLAKQIKSDTELNKNDATDRFLNLISFTLSDQFKFSTRYFAESLNLMVKSADKQTRMSTAMTKTMTDGKKTSMRIAELPKAFTMDMKERKKQQTGVLRSIKQQLGLHHKEVVMSREDALKREEKLDAQNTASQIEGKKDEENKNKNFLEKTGEFFTKPITELKESFSGIFDGILGKAGIATFFALIVTCLLATYKPFAEFVATGLNIIAGTFEGVGSLFRGQGPGDIAKIFEENFAGALAALTVFVTLIFPLVKRLGVVFFKLIAIPMMIFNIVEGIVEKIMRAMEMDLNPFGYVGAFLDGLIVGFLDGLRHVLKLLFDFILPSDIADSFMEVVNSVIDGIIGLVDNFYATGYDFIGGFIQNMIDGKAMGGSVAAGTPYIVGEQGAELFVPGAAGTILPAGSFGGMGGNIVVNNNQVNQSATSATHQHSNITLVDRQQEQVGL